MESSYGVGINNRYAVLLDGEGEENEDILVTKAKAKSRQLAAEVGNQQIARPANDSGNVGNIKHLGQTNNQIGGYHASSPANKTNRQQGNRVHEKNEANREGTQVFADARPCATFQDLPRDTQSAC